MRPPSDSLSFDWVSKALQNQFVQHLLLGLLVLLVVYVIVRLSTRLAQRYVEDPARLYHFTKTIRRTGSLVAVVAVLLLLSPGISDLLTVLTVIGAGLAIAMREALLSVAGWMRLAIAPPYTQGDRIEVNGLRGDVVDVRLLRTTMMEIGGWVNADQSTGRLVHFPNSWVFLHAVYNYSQGFHFIWNEISVTLTFRSDWEAAREIMLSLAEESAAIIERQAKNEIRSMAREYLIYYNILTPFVYVRITENGIRLTLRYLCEVRKRRGTEHALTISILKAFREHGGIEFAYPTVGVSTLNTPQFGPFPPTNDTSSQSTDGPAPGGAAATGRPSSEPS